MKRTQIAFLILFLSFFALTAGAKPIDVEKAQEIAEKFFKRAPQMQAKSGMLQLKQLRPGVQTRSVGYADYYLFTLETGQGFVIVSGDDELPEVVGYSFDSPVDEDNLPPALSAWLNSFGSYVEDVRSGKAAAMDTRAEGGGKMYVAPLITTKWNQDKPFNDLVMNNYVTGCVATSIAQIMKYHNWPVQGEGVLEWFGNLSGEYDRVDLSTYTYDWDNMIDEYRLVYNNNTGALEPDGYTDEQAKAVATLMRDCGYAVEMDYSPSGSGAVTSKLVGALITHFKYSPGIKYLSRNIYSQDKWTELIRAELEAGRPVNYSGTSSGDGVGHSFVCDGIDSDDLLHINWGWGGMYDGFFDMNVMAPEGIGIGGGSGGYILNQAIITGIRPITPEEEGQQPIDRLTMEGLSMQLLEDGSGSYRLSIVIDKIANSSSKTVTAIPGIVWHATGQASERLQRVAYLGALNVGYYYYDLSFNIYPSAEDFNGPGDYPFSIVNFTNESGSGYVPYDTGDTENGGILTLHEDGSMTLQLAHPEATPNLHLVSIHTGGTIYADQRINLTATFRNEGTKTYTEGLYIVAIPEGTDESGIDYSDYLQGSNGVTAPIYGKSTMEVPAFSWGLDAGRYTIHFCRETTQEDGSLAYLPVPEDAPQMLEVKPIPDHPVLLMDEYPLDVWNDEYKQEAAVWFGATVYLRALSQSYEGRLELWALKDGVDPSEEVLVFAYAQDNLSIGNSSTVYIYGFYGDTDAFFDMEEGTYTAYLKYEVNGEMQRIEGDYNQDKFRVVRSDKPQLYLTAPVVVNNGEPVPMGSTVTVEMQVSSRVAFNGRVEVYSSTSNEAALYSSSQSVSLEAGEMKTLVFRCQSGTGGYGLTAGTYCISMNSYDENNYWAGNVLAGEYGESLWFSVTEATGNPLTRKTYPLIDGRDFTYAGRNGTISFDVYAAETVDAVFHAHAYDRGDENTAILQYERKSVHFEAGETKRVEIPYACPEGTLEGEYYCDILVSLNGQSAMNFMTSIQFEVTEKLTGIEDVRTGNGKSYVVVEDNAFLLRNIPADADVEVFSANGAMVYKGAATTGTEMRIPMSNASKGVYFVVVTVSGEKPYTMKAVLK